MHSSTNNTNHTGETNAPKFSNIELEKVKTDDNAQYANTTSGETVDSLIKENLKSELARGIIKIFQTNPWIIRIFLFVCVAATVGFTSFMIVDSFLSYFAYEVSTKSRTIFETPSVFPKVTICNLNPFTTEYAANFLKEINARYYPHTDIFNSSQMNNLSYSVKHDLLSNLSVIAMGTVNSINFTDEQRKQLAHRDQEVILSCMFDQQKCSVSDFQWMFDKRLGNCYVFNSGFNSSGLRVDLRQSTFAGSEFRLKVGTFVINERIFLFDIK